MRLDYYASILIGLAAALSAGLPAHATIVDTGEVVLTGNDLVIGNTADGSRTVAGDTDGPYDSATLGVADGVTGTLSLDGATFTTTGTFTAGVGGAAIVQGGNGSTLATGDAVLGTATITLDGVSSWINGGAMSYSGAFGDPAYSDGPNLVVTGGAHVSTDGVLAGSFNSGADGLEVTIDGPGSSWQNDGELHLDGSSVFSVLNGATARDDGVFVEQRGYATQAIVDGAGSTWDTGKFTWNGVQAEGQPGLFVTNGARVTSSSAILGLDFSIVKFKVDGAGSIWSIAGALQSRADTMSLSVTGGATLESGAAEFGSSDGDHFVSVSGSGSVWDLRGSLRTFSKTDSFGVGQGGTILIHGDASLGSVNNGIGVDGAGSLFRTEGSLTLQPWLDSGPFVPQAVFSVANGARAEVWNGVTAFEDSRIEVHGATLATPMIALHGGSSLIGEGNVDGDVMNAGHVAPGVGAGALEVTGSFAQTSDGALTIELGGTQAGIDYAVLAVLGTSTLAGALEVVLADGYQPVLGDVYEVLQTGARVGEFASYVGLDVGGGVSLVPEYGPTSLVLRAVPEPTTASLVALGLVVLSVARKQREQRRRA